MTLNFRKLIVFAPATLLIISWAYLQWRRADVLTAQSNEIFTLSSAELLDVGDDEVPDASSAYAKMAVLVGRRSVPPDHQAAVDYLTRALVLEPLRSDYWLSLSRHFFFLKERDKARAALTRADVLDPVYPAQRMESMKLWTLMGERERGLELARKIALLDQQARREVSSGLLLVNVDSEQAFKLIGGATLPLEEVNSLLPMIKTGDTGSMERMWADIPTAFKKDPDFRQTAAVVFTKPLVYSVASSLWRASSKTLEEISIGTPPESLLIDDPSMNENPLQNRFYYGWQPITKVTWVNAAYVADRKNELNLPTVRLSFTGTGAPTMQRDFEWVFYRLPLAPMKTPISVRVKILPEPPGDSICRIVARSGNSRYGSKQTEWAVQGWQAASLVIPPSEDARVVELLFERNRRGMGADSSSKVYMTGFEIQAADPVLDQIPEAVKP